MASETGLTRTPQTQSLVQSDQRSAITPACDIFENQDEILLLADLPGVTPEALSIHIDQGELAVEARRELNSKAVDFRRRFQLPSGIDGSKVNAQLKNGVLTLRLPKSDALKPREIKVRAG